MTSPRLAFVTFPEPGHFNPMARVARRAIEQGARVTFFSLGTSVAERLRAAGIDAPSGSATADDAPAVAPREGRAGAFVARVRRGGAWYARWMRYVLLDLVGRQEQALAAFLANARPDVVCTDPLAYAGAVAAERAKIPWAAVHTQLLSAVPEAWRCEYVDILRSFHPEIDALVRSYGVEHVGLRGAELVSPWLNVMFTSEALTPRALSGNVDAFFVGPPSSGQIDAAPAFPWERLRPSEPLVYVASGTQFAFPRPFYGMMADAARALGAQAVFAGASAVEALHDRDDVVAVPSAPQIELLERAAAFVNHGGANSVLEGLARGRPTGVLPLGHEQPIQATLVEARGVGVFLREAGLDRDGCIAALRALLSREIVEATQRVAASFTGDGAARAADLLLDLARNREPRRPVISSSAG